MKILFISNFMNHHQLSFSDKMNDLTNNNFTFLALTELPVERKELGYSDMNKLRNYIISTKDLNHSSINSIINDSNAIIIGSVDKRFYLEYLNIDKLKFIYSEHIYKTGYIKYLNPRGYIYAQKLHNSKYNKNAFLLAASGYAAFDFSLLNAYRNRALKWGYFPPLTKYNIDSLINDKNSNSNLSIVWIGRLIKWKKPFLALKLAKYLKSKHYKFTFTIIGTGPLETKIKKYIANNNLESNIKLIGSIPHTEVVKYLEHANVLISTSDYNEGWGAVVNEGMNTGCALVVSHKIGSVPHLITNKVNGLVFKSGSLKSLINATVSLIKSEEIRTELGRNAYYTINNIWNHDQAASNLYRFITGYINDENFIIKEGPCSRADVISYWKFYKKKIRIKNVNVK